MFKLIKILACIVGVFAIVVLLYRFAVFVSTTTGYAIFLLGLFLFVGLMYSIEKTFGKTNVYPRFLLLISSIGLIVTTFYFPAEPEFIYQKGDSVSEEMWGFPLGKIRQVPLVYRVTTETNSGLKVNLVFHPTKEQALEYDPNDVERFLHQFLRNRIAEMSDYSDVEIQSLKEKLLILPENLVGEISGTVTITTSF